MNRVYVDRSRSEDYNRCKRLRFLGYHEGSVGRGIQPVRKSIHLVLGGAVHVGLETLLSQSQIWLSSKQNFDEFFSLAARSIEDEAVKDALADLALSTQHGIELDEQEKVDPNQPKPTTTASASSTLTDQLKGSLALLDSPIMIEFGEVDASTGQFVNTPESPEKPVEVPVNIGPTGLANFSEPIYQFGEIGMEMNPDTGCISNEGMAAQDARLAEIEVASQQQATGMDDYLKEELAAQVEAMIRAYARRRLRPLLEQFEVLEVEREGMWKLGEVEGAGGHDWYSPSDDPNSPWYDTCSKCSAIRNSKYGIEPCRYSGTEVYFMSRLDALLLERSTNILYLQSYKTTGAWDRRKEADAQIDMQGLSEAVDVDNRLREAWKLVNQKELILKPRSDGISTLAAEMMRKEKQDKIDMLVEPRVAEWLRSSAEPPRVLGVRYEYLLKGPRRADKKDPQQPGRYVADTPLIRAWMQEGITGDDRRWGHSYDYFDITGKGKRLDYRSWRKVPVWKHMPISAWIDRLDAGLVQAEAYDERGYPIDLLAEQFIEPIHVYRNEDDLRDMLEQLESQEVKIAVDVAAVKAVADDPMRKRSELNKRFPQNRRACAYPGKCSMFQICYGNSEMRMNPEASEFYAIRQVNHPQELEGK